MAGYTNSNGESIGPLEYGRQQYQQKNYSKALEAFTEAVDQTGSSLQLTALDHRAATLEKLGNLKSALKDSKQMIDLKPELAKGYLRCAKVLQLKGEKALALKIYERGLTKVKIGTDNDRTTLQSMYNKLRIAQNPGKSLDPLQFLPLELVQMVLQYLTIRDHVICLAVSKLWKKLLESLHGLWTTFDTTYTFGSISQNSLKVYLRRSNYTLEQAVIHSKAQFDAKKMAYLTKTCKRLTYLEMNGSGYIGESLISALPFAQNLATIVVSERNEVTLSAVLSALTICQNTLVEATFLRVKGRMRFTDKLPELKLLEKLQLKPLLFQNVNPIIDLSQIVTAAPNLRYLSLNDWHFVRFDSTTVSTDMALNLSQCQLLEHVDLMRSHMPIMPWLPSTIKTLLIGRNSERSFGESMLAVARERQKIHGGELFNFPLLEEFDCEGISISAALVKQITHLSNKAGNLKSLFIGNRWVADEDYPASNTVKNLSLQYMGHLSEASIIKIVDLYPNLEKLDVSNTKITGVAVKHFVEMGIKWLIAIECTQISTDAIEFARGKGVDVQFKFPSRARPNAAFRDSFMRAI
ncbi:hypothetical protein B0O99DRAFT_331748 [Bisporella sp. PMI_857]|nr:hypothetical protein B0O99DRAFT_331748 [Bisporella sp. PMI_857]